MMQSKPCIMGLFDVLASMDSPENRPILPKKKPFRDFVSLRHRERAIGEEIAGSNGEVLPHAGVG